MKGKELFSPPDSPNFPLLSSYSAPQPSKIQLCLSCLKRQYMATILLSATVICLILCIVFVLDDVYHHDSYPYIKIACVGDSITWGDEDNSKTYPGFLQKYMGTGFEVKNFGNSSRTVLFKGDYPYVFTTTFTDALSYKPDIVIIQLGTNDAKIKNWKYHDDFIHDLSKIIESFVQLSSHPIVYLSIPPPCYIDGRIGINSTITNDLFPNYYMPDIAYKTSIRLIDVFDGMGGKDLEHPDWFRDGVHPTTFGYSKLANIIFKKIVSN